MAWESPRNTRDIYAARLKEEEGVGERRRIADAVAAGVAWLLDWIAAKSRRTSPASPQLPQNSPGKVVAQTVTDATRTAVGAYEGKLEGLSLEGDLRRAQIEREYAEVRKANAEAKKIEVEIASMQLRQQLELAREFNIPIDVLQLPDGTLAVALGRSVIEEHRSAPELALAPRSEAGTGSAVIAADGLCSACHQPISPNTADLVVRNGLRVPCRYCGVLFSRGDATSDDE